MQNNSDSVALITKVLKKYDEIDLPAEGTSMFPLIKKGDICTFRRCDPSEFQRGDIILFLTSEGRLVAHRLMHKKLTIDKCYFLFKGDTNLGFDEPIFEENIIGKLALVKRNQIKFSSANLVVHAWSRLIIWFPIISYWLRLYLNRKRKLQF
ncbi:signal peptidase I [Pseudalkalibacillus caeni]|uniref:Signal peptidase I n=1 Tax=Exobacillus caeni TaxID=2574798 RepID=A0A5R9EWF9_9BACL|nr:signal peptidase I [Pseudalkalibacillus caeni]TLS35562.1 signal peptidase I [Pseudalkalibacillus caeni]